MKLIKSIKYFCPFYQKNNLKLTLILIENLHWKRSLIKLITHNKKIIAIYLVNLTHFILNMNKLIFDMSQLNW